MKELFVRTFKKNFNQDYLDSLKTKLNINTLNKWTYKKTVSLYEKKYEEEYLYYRFSILHEWFIQNEKYDKYFLELLESTIEALGLNSFLNVKEVNYLNTFKSYIFTNYRNIKSLIVDFALEKNESIYFHYNNIVLGSIETKKIVPLKWVSDIYFGTQRFVFSGHLQLISIALEDIQKIIFREDFIILKTPHKSYAIIGKDLKIIETSIKRLYKILKLGDAIWMDH